MEEERSVREVRLGSKMTDYIRMSKEPKRKSRGVLTKRTGDCFELRLFIICIGEGMKSKVVFVSPVSGNIKVVNDEPPPHPTSTPYFISFTSFLLFKKSLPDGLFYNYFTLHNKKDL